MTPRSLTVIGIALVAVVACARGASGFNSEPLNNSKEKTSYTLSESIARQMETRAKKDHKANLAALQRERMRTRQAAAAASNSEPATRMVVSYKVDPRLATGTYGGSERWVSPPTYTQVGDAHICKVTVRVRGLDAGGRPTAIDPRWTASDSQLVSITPSDKSDVTLIVQRPGTSRVHVRSHGVSQDLEIKAAHQNGALQVQITTR